MYVNVLRVWRVPEEGTEFSETRVAEGSDPQDRYWEVGEASALNRLLLRCRSEIRTFLLFFGDPF